MPVRALRLEFLFVTLAHLIAHVRILLMPVRALRLRHTHARSDMYILCQNPINARKGITTEASHVIEGVVPLVRILLMPVRALRHIVDGCISDWRGGSEPY